MKRIISIICVFCLVLAGISVFGDTAGASDEKMLYLSFAKIEGLVVNDNLAYRNNVRTINNLSDAISNDTFSALLLSRNQLQQLMSETQTVYIGLLTPENLASTDPVMNALLPGVRKSLENDIGSYLASIKQIDMQIDQFYITPRVTIDTTIQQLEYYNKQIVWGVESLFMGYHTLTRQLDMAEENLKVLDGNIKAMEQRFLLGQITEAALLDIKSTRAALDLGIRSMKTELANLEGQLNMLINRNHDAPLDIEKMPETEMGFLKTVDAEKDLRLAKTRNHLIAVAEIEIEEYSRSFSDSNLTKLRIAENNYISEVRTVEFKYESLSRAITDKEAMLDSAKNLLGLRQKLLEETKVKYGLGMVSKLDVDKAESDLLLQTINVSAANAELFAAIRRYEWLVRGIGV